MPLHQHTFACTPIFHTHSSPLIHHKTQSTQQGGITIKAEASIDYLTFRIMGHTLSDVAEQVLEIPYEELELLETGLNRYKNTAKFGNIKILYNGRKDMGICVTMSGKACSEFDLYHGGSAKKMLALIKKISQTDMINITRLDIACDDFDGYLCMDTIIHHAENGLVKTRSTARTLHQSHKGAEDAGRSIYFGSALSPFRLRIYNKAKQMYAPGNPLYNSHWIRLELVLRKGYADQAAFLLADSACVDSIGKTVAGLISDKINFVVADDSDAIKYSPADWWSDFLGSIRNVSLTSPSKTLHNIDSHLEWLKISCSRIIAKIIEAVGRERFDREVIAYGKFKLTKNDLAMIKDYKTKERIASAKTR
jgi:DNA relaxase NicK